MKLTQLNARIPAELRRVVDIVSDAAGFSVQDLVADALAYSFGSRDALVIARRDRAVASYKQLLKDGKLDAPRIDGGPANSDLTNADQAAKSPNARALRERGLPFRDAVAESGIAGMPAFA